MFDRECEREREREREREKEREHLRESICSRKVLGIKRYYIADTNAMKPIGCKLHIRLKP